MTFVSVMSLAIPPSPEMNNSLISIVSIISCPCFFNIWTKSVVSLIIFFLKFFFFSPRFSNMFHYCVHTIDGPLFSIDSRHEQYALMMINIILSLS